MDILTIASLIFGLAGAPIASPLGLADNQMTVSVAGLKIKVGLDLPEKKIEPQKPRCPNSPYTMAAYTRRAERLGEVW